VHFFGLAVVFGERFFHWLGGAITACGLAGIGLAGTGAGDPSIALVAGVLPGVMLLCFAWWGAHRSARLLSSIQRRPGARNCPLWPGGRRPESARPGDSLCGTGPRSARTL